MRKAGTDEYGRFFEINGIRYLVEPFPFKDSWRDYFWVIRAQLDIAVWHVLSRLRPFK